MTWQNFKTRFGYCLSNVQLGSKEEIFWHPNDSDTSRKLLLFPSSTVCLDLEQFLFVPASVYNKSLITPSVAKQELPKNQPSQNPTYKIDSLKKEINKKLFFKAESLLDKIFFVHVSSSQIHKL